MSAKAPSMQLLQIQKQLPPPLDTHQRYSVPEALALLRTSRKTFYDLVKTQRVAVIKEGKRTYVPGTEIARLSAAPAVAAP
jgi:hypothetical protein